LNSPGTDYVLKKELMTSMDVGGGKTTLPQPLFMKNKAAEQYSDEEVAAAESHLAEVLRIVEKSQFRRRELEAEKGDLQILIDGLVEDIDAKIEELFWLRINVEKCILCEELKILNLNRDLVVR
jgi:hypothetical protein